jgi:hypothetical protein
MWKTPAPFSASNSLCLFLAPRRRIGNSPPEALCSRTERSTKKENVMGLLEEAAGAFAAVEGVKKLDPNAGIITEAVAGIAGFEGAGAIENIIEKKEEEHNDQQQS